MTIKAEDFMITDMKVINANDSVENAAKLLLEHNISGLPVVNDEGELVGVISEGDLVFQNKRMTPPAMVDILGAIISIGSQERYLKELHKALATDVGSVMTTNVITAKPEHTLEQLATMMIDNDVNRLPVIKDGKLVGIVTRQDIIRIVHTNR